MTQFTVLFFAILGGVLLAGCGPVEGRQETEAEALADIEAWRTARMAELRQPDSWLSLVGLYWLEEGENRFGSAPDNDLVFPEKAPAHIGSFWRVDSTARMEVVADVTVRYQGEPVSEIEMDAGGETASVILEWESLSWFLLKRDHGLGLRLKDSESPAIAAFDGVDAFPVDLGWRLQGRFEPYDPPRTVLIPTVLNTEATYIVPGAMAFEVDGETYRLDVTGQPADSAFFVIFGDATNGKETYGGGRYLWVDAPDADRRMTIDFNKAYNPPCVFTPYATCPLPTRQNRLALRIESGELTYGKGV